jgi:hypothetical protein
LIALVFISLKTASGVIIFAWTLFINLEAFCILIRFQKKGYGKYSPKVAFLVHRREEAASTMNRRK